MTYGFFAPNAVTMADCACCGCRFERDPCDPETVSCGMCQAGESPGMDATPSDVELQRVNYELDCGIAHVLPYG
jgi:hypothetical protein